MSIYEGSYPSLTHGVSQQVPFGRIEGQHEEQLNMLSDRVTGLRRRPGIQYKTLLAMDTFDSIKSFYIEQGDSSYHVLINNKTGTVYTFDSNYTLLNTKQDNYFIASKATSIHEAPMTGSTWLLNTEIKPTLGPAIAGTQNPDRCGWFQVLTGAYSRSYALTLSVEGVYTGTFTYVTPSGSGAGDVAASIPEKIANAIAVSMNATPALTAIFNVTQVGPYIAITKKTGLGGVNPVKVAALGTKTHSVASGVMQVTLVTDLPANLPPVAEGFITAVGSKPDALAYYRWSDATSTWIECGSYGSADTLLNTPRKLTIEGVTVTHEVPVFEGRRAGSEHNNPYSAIITYGITGLSAYQGRLVLLAGGYACLSASNRPLRFMRSTVVDLRDDDPIEISAGALTAAVFRYAIPFNKDLVLISGAHQAVIPVGSTSITPKNAMVVLSSRESINTAARPCVMSRTLVYSTAVSSDYLGAGELIPSQYSASQYSANNLTAHIPRYIAGGCRSIANVSASSLGCYLATGDLNSALVQEYTWEGDERSQNAWHKWEFLPDILSMHTDNNILVFTFRIGDNVVIGTLDARSASYQQLGAIPAFLDMRIDVTVTDNQFYVPMHLRNAAYASRIRAAQAAGAMSGEPVGIVTIDTNTWVATTVRSFREGQLTVGYSYKSALTPTEPFARDKNRAPIQSAKIRLLRYTLGVRNTGEFDITTKSIDYADVTVEDSAVLWSSVELGLGAKQAVEYGRVVVPVRAAAPKTKVEFSTDNTRELNIVNLGYLINSVVKHRQG